MLSDAADERELAIDAVDHPGGLDRPDHAGGARHDRGKRGNGRRDAGIHQYFARDVAPGQTGNDGAPHREVGRRAAQLADHVAHDGNAKARWRRTRRAGRRLWRTAFSRPPQARSRNGVSPRSVIAGLFLAIRRRNPRRGYGGLAQRLDGRREGVCQHCASTLAGRHDGTVGKKPYACHGQTATRHRGHFRSAQRRGYDWGHCKARTLPPFCLCLFGWRGLARPDSPRLQRLQEMHHDSGNVHICVYSTARRPEPGRDCGGAHRRRRHAGLEDCQWLDGAFSRHHGPDQRHRVFFPSDQVLPSHIVGAISLVVLAIAIVALYGYRLAGSSRWIYVVGAVIALYLNVFVLVAQGFQKVAFLNSLAPTQSDPGFIIAQTVVLVIFIVLGIRAVRSFHPEANPAALRPV